MIFVTVGTHEQAFDRLIKYIDNLKKEEIIKEDVFIQTGYSNYKPKYCKWKKLIPYSEMDKMNKEARIVITHGGPASFIAPLQYNKIPIVVPRQFEYNEHVNNHQVEFSLAVAERMKNIITVINIDELKDTILNYDKIVKEMNNGSSSNNEKFCSSLEIIVNEMMYDKYEK